MLDFIEIESKIDKKKNDILVYPSFYIKNGSKDLMTKGKAFYAIWDEEAGLWSTNEIRAGELIDKEVDIRAKEMEERYPGMNIRTVKTRRFNSKKWQEWQQYCKSIPDNFHQLDMHVTFANDNVNKEDYISHRLPYAIEETPTPAYDELMNKLYYPEERTKLEWAIGSVIQGDSVNIQKFFVLYGGPGSGKSTVLNIYQQVLDGYCQTFDAKAVGNSNATFALEAFKDNPLVVIQHDGDLSRIEDNARLNSIVSHESIIVNEKHKSTYSMRFSSMLFMGTNKPVRITDAKSGLMRRLIDVSPTGDTFGVKEYNRLMEQIKFEIGGIANKCLQTYISLGKNYYQSYKPVNMIGITNDFYNFVDDNLDFFLENQEKCQLKKAWQRYKEYVTESNMQFPFSMKNFKEELKNYFAEYADRKDGERKVYLGFLKDKFDYSFVEVPKEDTDNYVIDFGYDKSIFDKEMMNCLAQYAKDDKPEKKWDDVTTKLVSLDTTKTHYVMLPPEHIVIDFDLKNEKGEKDFGLNLEAASKFPPTYAELSKSGAGIHLHYIYTGDVNQLKRLYADDIEIKVFTGKSSLRRRLSKCNNLPIAKISSGLPLKEEAKMVNFEAMQSEKQLRAFIKSCLAKKHHGATKPEVDFIYSELEKAYNSGMHYDVTDMRPAITAFACSSTHQAEACLKIVSKMKFKSEEASEPGVQDKEAPIVFFDCEVFPNLFLINWKFHGKDKQVVRMINPTPKEVEDLFKFRLIGYNCRRYDNHILYARSIGYTNEELFRLSQRIVNADKKDENRNCFFQEAYNLSYTDIYDFEVGDHRKSLKRWEVELGIHHQELEFDWNQPVPEEKWIDVAEYCDNDVISTEAVFDHLKEDWKARQMLAVLSGLTPNDTTNSHTTRLIVGTDRSPQDKFVYTDLSKQFPGYRYDPIGIDPKEYKEGTKIVSAKSIYKGEDPSEGGYVYAEPGMYYNVALLDVASLHPSSAIILNIFGTEYTTKFAELKQLRIDIKHRNYEHARKMFDGKLAPFLENDEDADALCYALKIAINSVYGLTSAKFANKLKDPNNIDNIVAKRGALFMIDLKEFVQSKGYQVAHIKTDSIKIPYANKEIVDAVIEFGRQYGYDFEFEAVYEKMCLVNDAVYIARFKDPADCEKEYGCIPGDNMKYKNEHNRWTATGAEFAVPYVFKSVFSKEDIEFDDLCEIKQVQKGSLYLDMNENLSEDEHNYHFIGRVGKFCPIKSGRGGGVLYRMSDDKYYAAAGTKGYRFLETETVKELNKFDDIDMDYFNKLAEDAKKHVSEYGDFDWFVSDSKEPSFNDQLNLVGVPDNVEEIPFVA